MNTPNERNRGQLRVVTQDTRKVAPGADPQGLFAPGERIPGAGVRVVRVAGTGGFGVVYECDDTELDIPVAVKLLHAAAASSPEAARVFRDESRALAKINSEHVVGVRRFGFTSEPSPRPFIVMFKLEGHTLLDALSNYGRFDQIDTVVYGIHMAIGLAAAHHAGLVHRDLKPANVFLCKGIDPVTGKPITVAKLLDFGIARAASSGAPDSARLPIICSHPYCGPEQYQGRAHAQTDIYSLGVILFLMITREHPLGNFASDREWVQAKLVTKPKPQLVNEVLREMNLLRSEKKGKIPLVDPELEDLIDRSLSYDPADRPGTAEAVVRQLEVVLERLKAAKQAEEDARRRQKGLKPARGAATVPEPPTWMQKRVTEEYARSRQVVPEDEPETVQSLREVESQLERSKAIEQALLGIEPDHPLLTDAEVAAIVAGRHGAHRAPTDRFPRDVSKSIRQELILAGSTLESPQAAQRNARKWSTAGARVILAPDNTPIMEGAPRMPDLDPPDEDYRFRQRRGFTVANQALVTLPLTGVWRWRRAIRNFLEDEVFYPEKGKHWRVTLFVFSCAFAGTILVVVVATLVSWARPSPPLAASAEPAPAPSASGAPIIPTSTIAAASAAPAATMLPPPAFSVPVPAPVVAAPSGATPAASARAAGHGVPNSGPVAAHSATTAPAVVPAAAPAPAPTASGKYWYLLDAVATPSASAKPGAPPAKPSAAPSAAVPYMSPSID